MYVLASDIYPLLRSAFAEIGDLKRRAAGSEMRGKVTEVDASKALVRMEIAKDADGQPVLSPWLPYKQTAGALKLHNPPSVGQTMTIRSDSGDIEQGVAEAFHWSNDNSAISTDGEAHKLTFGSNTVDLTAGGLAFEVPLFKITGPVEIVGAVKITGDVTIVGDQTSSGTITNNGKDVGSSHTNLGLPVD